jgi:hypothetical protein
MKLALRIFALVFFLAAVGLWAAAGAHHGWSMTRVPRQTLDEVTGIEGITYEKKFVPGLDFVGAAGLGAGILAGMSQLFRVKTSAVTPSNQPEIH